MLKNRKSLYVLLPFLVIIWGLLGYRVYSIFFSQSKNINPKIYSSRVKSEIIAARYIPEMRYDDPFLKSERVKRNVSSSSKMEKHVVKEVEKTAPPPITYRGFIHGKNNDKTQAVIKFNSNIYIVGIDDVVETFTIKTITPDSIIVCGKNGKWKYPISTGD
jgi:hypothetical protein